MNKPSTHTSSANLTRIMIIAAAVVVIILGGFYIWINRAQPEAIASYPINRIPHITEEAQPEKPVPMETIKFERAPLILSTPKHAIIQPPSALDTSDSQVKLAIADLVPAMAGWLVSDQQIRKWVLAIDLMADGDVLKQYRPLSFPIARFEPDVRGDETNPQYFLKQESFSRADSFVSVFVAIDPMLLAQYYQVWYPLLNKAYQEQGKKDTFDERLRVALQKMIDVKPLAITPALVKRGGVIYTYADSQMESATDVEKMMWRMGPDNSLKIQNYLKQLQTILWITKAK